MVLDFKHKLLNLMRPRDMSGFMVEKFNHKQVSGWIIPEDAQDPLIQNFHVIENGADVGLQVRLFHRPVFSGLKKANLYGFRIRFSQ